jgi:hydrogenase expression/formation protein HypC
MCLGEVGLVRHVASPDHISVEVGGRLTTVSAMLLDSVPYAGDWVLVHSGFALAQLSESEARDALGLRSEMVSKLPRR